MIETKVIISIPEGKLRDYIDGTIRVDTPEEYVRQTVEKRLINEHKYSKEQIKIEYGVQMGSGKKRADIVIFPKDSTAEEMKARPFVCDDFQKNVLEIFSDSAGKKSALFDFGEPYAFWKENDKLIQWMQDKGFCMLVRATDKFNDYIEFLLPLLEKDKTILIYSMWKEYVNPKSKHANKKYLDFIDNFPKLSKIHTSGHASAECLADVCNLVNPKKGIIPIHSENSADYKKLPIKEELKDKIITETKTSDDMIIEIKRTTNRQHRV